jgi:hypothetical protein
LVNCHIVHDNPSTLRDGPTKDSTPNTSRTRNSRREQAANRHLDRHDKPIVAEHQRVFDEQHAREIGWSALDAAERNFSILEFPISIGRLADTRPASAARAAA